MIFPVVILAGGLATRLRPVTETIPKSLIEINAVPFINYQLNLLKKNGIKKIILCIGYLGEQIQDYLTKENNFDLEIRYSFDGPHLRGTAGAIKNALPHIKEDHFFVLYGDSYLMCNYHAVQAAFLQQKKLALMTVFHNEGKWDTSNVEFSNGTIHAYDKRNRTESMHYIDYGLGIFNKKAFEYIENIDPTNQLQYDLANLYQTLLKNNELAAYEVKERFYEVGSFAGIKELEELTAQEVV